MLFWLHLVCLHNHYVRWVLLLHQLGVYALNFGLGFRLFNCERGVLILELDSDLLLQLRV